MWVQKFNKSAGIWTKYNTETRELVFKKSPGAYKGIKKVKRF